MIPLASLEATYTRSTATSAEVNPSWVPSGDHAAVALGQFTIGRSPETTVGRLLPSTAATLRLMVASASARDRNATRDPSAEKAGA